MQSDLCLCWFKISFLTCVYLILITIKGELMETLQTKKYWLGKNTGYVCCDRKQCQRQPNYTYFDFVDMQPRFLVCNRDLVNQNVTVNTWVVNESWLFSLLWCAGVSSVTTNACHLLRDMQRPDWIMVQVVQCLSVTSPISLLQPADDKMWHLCGQWVNSANSRLRQTREVTERHITAEWFGNRQHVCR